MEQRKLGANGPDVGALGLGCMSFAGFYGPTDKAESFATLRRALDLGITHLDTALLYGMGLSETVIGEFIRDNPNEFVIASKCGIVPKPQRHFNNKPDYVREAVEGSLKRLGVDHIPLYYLHRREQEGELADEQGKADGDHARKRDIGPLHQDDRQAGHDETQRCQEKRRHRIQPEPDHHEIETPDRRDQDGERDMSERHAFARNAGEGSLPTGR